MNATLTRVLGRGRSTLAQIGPGQKALIAMMAVGLILGGVFFTRWITAPTYAPLFSNLASSDASAIVEELNASGVKYELADGGQTIMVDRDKVYDTRLAMSSKGLPAGDETGYALLDKQGITTSEFQQQVEYQRALEGELSNTLQALDGVRTAVVHVAIPEEDVFVSETSKPTASVLLDLEPGADLSATQIQAVTNLVSSSVEDLSPEQVTVADNTGAVLSAAGNEFGASGAGDAQSQMEEDYEARLAANAQQILDRIVGPGMAVVRVRADLNFDARETQTKTYTSDPDAAPISETETKESYNGGGTPTGGVLGPMNPTGAGGTSGGSDYKKETRTSNNSVGETLETTKDAPGSVERLTVSVVMDQRASVNADTASVEALVSNAVGLDPRRGDAIEVAAMALDTSAAERAAADLAAAKAAQKKEAQAAMIRTGVIGGLITLILLIAWWKSRKRRKVGPAVRPTTISVEQQDELNAIRAEIAARQAAVALPAAQQPEEVAKRQKVRAEIATMISDSPDEVAAMLRGWLAEEKV